MKSNLSITCEFATAPPRAEAYGMYLAQCQSPSMPVIEVSAEGFENVID